SHCISILFLFNDPPTTDIYTLSLHDALPIFPNGLHMDEHVVRVGIANAVDEAIALYAIEPFHLYTLELTGRFRQSLTVNVLARRDRKSTRLNSSHSQISYAVFCLKKKKKNIK